MPSLVLQLCVVTIIIYRVRRGAHTTYQTTLLHVKRTMPRLFIIHYSFIIHALIISLFTLAYLHPRGRHYFHCGIVDPITDGRQKIAPNNLNTRSRGEEKQIRLQRTRLRERAHQGSKVSHANI